MPPPLKRFGQNFLQNPYLQEKIVEALRIQTNDHILEIGPGHGALCPHIIRQNPAKYYAVEIDTRLIRALQDKYSEKMQLIHGDFMQVDLKSVFQAETDTNKIIGNIPYNITTPILFRILDNYQIINIAVLMVQKEVAERIASRPGTKDYGIPSVVAQTYGKVEYLFDVERINFKPAPNVDSAVIRISLNKEITAIQNHDLFRQIVRQVFNYRRKMIRNSLYRIFDKRIVYSLKSVNLNDRPEQIDVEGFINLSNELNERIKE
ncbi:MAG: ribosomal RNA small subunit methyltransferase A [Calditrichaceae bacterium]|nr:ribosomal RNA small subunit methyltransferase A [Calditrichaceae bacterium]MBN2710513.1 ribosomal RNA small subunit methyltransferase A [Calditrichaceae bacterium]RQV97305.1 MAG: ribosomal RNA small subunit methyltransferase A [Calditrichota bacterium]